MLTHIDHVTLAVRDLDGAIVHLRKRLGLFVSKKRVEQGSALENSVIPLLQGFIELISLNEDDSARKAAAPRSLTAGLNTFLAEREGLFGFAINSSSLREDVERLRASGSELSEPRHEAADVSQGEGGWWIASPPERLESILPGVIEYDLPPDERVRKAAMGQPYAIRTVQEVTVNVPSLEQALDSYEKHLGLRPARERAGQAQIHVGGTTINVVAARLTRLGAPVGLYAVGLGTTDVKAAQEQLQNIRVTEQADPFTWAPGFLIDPAETFGARISIVQL